MLWLMEILNKQQQTDVQEQSISQPIHCPTMSSILQSIHSYIMYIMQMLPKRSASLGHLNKRKRSKSRMRFSPESHCFWSRVIDTQTLRRQRTVAALERDLGRVPLAFLPPLCISWRKERHTTCRQNTAIKPYFICQTRSNGCRVMRHKADALEAKTNCCVRRRAQTEADVILMMEQRTSVSKATLECSVTVAMTSSAVPEGSPESPCKKRSNSLMLCDHVLIYNSLPEMSRTCPGGRSAQNK